MIILQHCQKLNISHRDLKPDNILYFTLGNGKFKLTITDFSEGKLISGKKELNSKRGNLRHIPPEAFYMFDEGEYDEYDPHKGDVYGLGVILIHLSILKVRPSRKRENIPPIGVQGLGPSEIEWNE